MRAIPQICIDMVKKFEGLRLQPYQDCIGHNTVGWGHLVLPGEDFSNGITLEQAEALLQQDLQRTQEGLEDALDVILNDNQYSACLDFCFNLGCRTFTQSTLCRLINQGEYDKASDEFPKWSHAGGHVIRGLLTRRIAEMDLFEQAC